MSDPVSPPSEHEEQMRRFHARVAEARRRTRRLAALWFLGSLAGVGWLLLPAFGMPPRVLVVVHPALFFVVGALLHHHRAVERGAGEAWRWILKWLLPFAALVTLRTLLEAQADHADRSHEVFRAGVVLAFGAFAVGAGLSALFHLWRHTAPKSIDEVV